MRRKSFEGFCREKQTFLRTREFREVSRYSNNRINVFVREKKRIVLKRKILRKIFVSVNDEKTDGDGRVRFGEILRMITEEKRKETDYVEDIG